jgi:dipeptidyl aminopeptidase/acylaminoacyl peptidase
MSVAIDSTFEPEKLPFTNFEFGATEQLIDFRAGKRQFKCDIAVYRCTLGDTVSDRMRLGRRSPDGRWNAYVYKYNLYVQPVAGGEPIQLTTDGDSLRAYGLHAGPLGIQRDTITSPPAIHWSPNSRKIAVERYDFRGVKVLPLYSSTSTRPKYYLYHYGLPGDSVIARFDIHILDVTTKSNVRVQADQNPSINDVSSISDSAGAAKWAPTSDKLFFINATRGAKRLALMVADAATGVTRRLVSDSVRSPSGTVDVGPGGGGSIWAWRVTENENDAYWYSARDGWGHIYRFDGSGKLRLQVTAGPWTVRRLDFDDRKNGALYITIRGREPDRFPYYSFLYRAKTDGSGLTLLTPEPAEHSVKFAPSGKYFVDTYATRDLPPVTVLRSAIDGKIIRELERADVSRLKAIGFAPADTFSAIASDGVSVIYGIIWKPATFDSTKVYPVVDYIYPVPGANIQQFGYIMPDQMEPRALAELGFVVTQVMARGTGGRSKPFLDAYQGRMGQNTVPDHVTAIQQLGARHRWIDLSRVGIYGHSGGGFASTSAILRFPEFFKVAVSSSGNHDNRTYGAFWGEKYQGLLTKDPKTGKDNFEDEANYTLAKNLKGHLLLMHGDMDDNVHPAHTLRLVHALIAADKKFDLMIFPDRGHGLNEPYAHRMRFDYFVKYLMGVEPPEYVFSKAIP